MRARAPLTTPASPSQPPRSLRDYAAPGSLLLLCYAGYFKGDPLLARVPDLTILGAALALTGILAVLAADVVPRGTLVVLSLWALFIPAAIFHAGDGYGSSKALRLFMLTLLAAAGTVFLIRSRRRQQAWVLMQITLGCVLALGAWLSPAPPPADGAVSRLALDGSNAIAAGRAAGVAVVACLILALAGHRRRLPLAVLGLGGAVPMFLSGSRGPVLAAAVAVAAVAVLAPTSGVRRAGRVLLTATGGSWPGTGCAATTAAPWGASPRRCWPEATMTRRRRPG